MADKPTLAERLQDAQRNHYECEDCWYSCSQDPDCCDDRRAGRPCDCGADQTNELLREAAAALSESSRQDAEDARRYRYLKDQQPCLGMGYEDSAEARVIVFTWPKEFLGVASLDAAIDAALASSKAGEGT